MAELKPSEEVQRGEPARRRRGPGAVVPFAIGALVAAVAISNRDDVEVDLVVTSWQTPLVVLIAVSVLAGMLVGWLLGIRRRRR